MPFTATTTPTSAILPTLDRIREFADLEADWDGEEAYAPSVPAYMDAVLLLVRSLDLFDWSNVQVDAVPVCSGGVLIEWRRDDQSSRHQIHVTGKRGIRSLAAVKITTDGATKTQRYVDEHADSLDDALEGLRRTMTGEP